MGKKIILGLSGGVDSAVAAHLLKEEGWDVTGAFLVTGCDDGSDAERTAEQLGIDFIRIDVRKELKELVQEPFASAYLRGETPNPCIMCNPAVKFPALIKAADLLGAKFVATGHYARTLQTPGGVKLLRGRAENDQSYMLSSLRREQLERVIFPLGEYNKSEVRSLAEKAGLSVAAKPDSMEICFVPDGDYAAFIERMKGKLPEGDFVDAEGNVLGRHKGIHRYTVGQRRGLGIALGKRVFVSKIDGENNRVVLSDGEDVFVKELILPEVNWISIAPPEKAFSCTVRVRHSKTESAAVAEVCGESVKLRFESSVRAPTAGQSAVLYDGDTVLAAGVIC